MKWNLTRILLLLLATAGVFKANAQGAIWINPTGGQKVSKLEKLKTITSDENGLQLNLMDRLNSHYNYSSAKALTLSDIQASGISTLANATKSVSLYPTSVRGLIHLNNLPEGEYRVILFRTDGTVVMQTRLSGVAQTIEVGFLARGFYLISINNQILKFYKL